MSRKRRLSDRKRPSTEHTAPEDGTLRVYQADLCLALDKIHAQTGRLPLNLPNDPAVVSLGSAFGAT